MNINRKIIAENRGVSFQYEILEKYEAGIELNGQEVKSSRVGRFNLRGSYVILRNGQAWLINSQIPAYQEKNAAPGYDPGRKRRLLLKKREIKNLAGRVQEKSFSLVPASAYLKRNLIKLELVLVRTRKKRDQREYIKKRDLEQEIKRKIK